MKKIRGLNNSLCTIDLGFRLDYVSLNLIISNGYKLPFDKFARFRSLVISSGFKSLQYFEDFRLDVSDSELKKELRVSMHRDETIVFSRWNPKDSNYIYQSTDQIIDDLPIELQDFIIYNAELF